MEYRFASLWASNETPDSSKAERCMESFQRSNFHRRSFAISRSASADDQTCIPQLGIGCRGRAIAHPLHTPPMMTRVKPLVQDPSLMKAFSLSWMNVTKESRNGGYHCQA